jgi:hypothetical protein
MKSAALHFGAKRFERVARGLSPTARFVQG